MFWDDPFFDDEPRRSGFSEIIEDMQKSMRSMSRMMDQMWRGYHTHPAEEEHAEKKDEDYQYSSETKSSYSNGVSHTKTRTTDSRTGKTNYIETRRIGDKSVTMKREIDKDGKQTNTHSLQNVKEEELDQFNHEWETKKKSVPSLKSDWIHHPALL